MHVMRTCMHVCTMYTSFNRLDAFISFMASRTLESGVRSVTNAFRMVIP